METYTSATEYKKKVSVELPDTKTVSVDTNIIHKNNDKLFIFLSLDLCNSTKMKDITPNWTEVITHLYNTKSPLINMDLWKFIGDEVVFYAPYVGINELVNLIISSYEKIESLENELTEIAKTSNPQIKIEIKGTLWLSYVSDNSKTVNIRIREFNEFIGKQIDEGFRMSVYSSSSKLLLDPKIVFILLTLFSIDATEISSNSAYEHFAKNFLENMDPELKVACTNKLKELVNGLDPRKKISKIIEGIYFVQYEYLKGIWGEAPYPIFWYFDQYEKLKYHEAINGGPVSILYHQSEKYYENPDHFQDQFRYYSRNLFQLYSIVHADKEIIEILKVIANTEYESIPFSNGTAQLYYSIACVKDNKVLIAKRGLKRKHLRGVWEFGFKKHSSININDNIRNFCKDEFNLDVDPITDGVYKENIFPIHFCTTYRNNIKHNSILCCANIISDLSIDELEDQINQFIKSKNENSDNIVQYIEAKFVDYNEACKLFKELTLQEVEIDSYQAQIGKSITHNEIVSDEKQEAIIYFLDSIKTVLSFSNIWNNLDEQKWTNLLTTKDRDDNSEEVS